MITVTILKAIADDNRLEIVRHLVREDKPCASKEVVPSCSSVLDLSQPTLSHHMKQLVLSGVVKEEKVDFFLGTNPFKDWMIPSNFFYEIKSIRIVRCSHFFSKHCMFRKKD